MHGLPESPPENSIATNWVQSGRSFLTDPFKWAWLVVAMAWGLLLFTAFTGQWHLFHPQGLAEPLSTLNLLVFLAAWQVMTIAMMLPSTLPFAQLFVKVSNSQSDLHLVLLAFLAAYLSVWTGFALIAFAGNLGLQRLVQYKLHQQSELILPLALLIAGLFQFSPLKDQCLHACRHPYSFLIHHYQRGTIAAWKLGIQHGLYCLGCCWALMLVMVFVGFGHWVWMLVLTGVMTLERVWKHGQALVPIVGMSLIGVGLWMILWSRNFLSFASN